MAKAFMPAGILVLAFAIGLVPIPGVAGEGEPLKDVKFIIEHNATDEDTGFQVFLDGERWNRLEVESPTGRSLLEVRTRGPLRFLGLTEFFFETTEPPNKQVPIGVLLEHFPEGEYELEAHAVGGGVMTGEARLTHVIPKGPEILTPRRGQVVDPDNAVVSWKPVTESIRGEPVEIVGYEVIIGKLVDAPPPPGFSKLVLSVHVTGRTTSLTAPPEFFEPATEYEFEVLALEVGGNQTISSSTFVTK
jgi:hypothetical protein